MSKSLFTVKTGNHNIGLAVFNRLKELGWLEFATHEQISRNGVTCHDDGKMFWYHNTIPESIKCISLDDLFYTEKYKREQPKEIALNSEYTVKVYKDRIEVGCQTFSIEKFNELAEIVKDVSLELQ